MRTGGNDLLLAAKVLLVTKSKKKKAWLAGVLLLAAIFGILALVDALGLSDRRVYCGGGKCSSGTAIWASMISIALLFAYLTIGDWIKGFKDKKADEVRQVAKQKIAKQKPLTPRERKALTSEDHFAEFRRQVEEERKTRIENL